MKFKLISKSNKTHKFLEREDAMKYVNEFGELKYKVSTYSGSPWKIDIHLEIDKDRSKDEILDHFFKDFVQIDNKIGLNYNLWYKIIESKKRNTYTIIANITSSYNNCACNTLYYKI